MTQPHAVQARSSRVGHILIAWVLMVAAGGEGAFAVYHSPTPMGIFNTLAACDIARGKKIAEYRSLLELPIRSGYDYIEGGVPPNSRYSTRTGSRQLYILTCEPTKGR